MITENTNYVNRLLAINVNDKIELKNGLKYLQWMYAWEKLKSLYPESRRRVYEREDGRIYWDDGKTAWVKVSVTLVTYTEDGEKFEDEQIEYLPIMDFKNKSIPVDKIESTHVNNSIQRAFVKCIARLGLGAYVYEGEETPTETATDIENITELMKRVQILTRELTSNMTKEEKYKFANEVIVPIVGVQDYRGVKNIEALQKLLNKLEEMAGETEAA